MNDFIDLGGHPIKISQDAFSDGRSCVVAEHPDLPGCVAYAATRADALAALGEARRAYQESVRRHEGSATPTTGTPKILPRDMTVSSGAGWVFQTA